jgi:hypothetical protein
MGPGVPVTSVICEARSRPGAATYEDAGRVDDQGDPVCCRLSGAERQGCEQWGAKAGEANTSGPLSHLTPSPFIVALLFLLGQFVLTKHRALDLSSHGHWQGVDKLYLAWVFVRGQLRFHKGL